VIALVGVVGLLFTGLATILWRTRRMYPGFGLWATAGVLAVLSLYLMTLGPNTPDAIRRMGGNITLVVATVLYADGARRFRGRPTGRGFVYGGGALTLVAYAFFLYVVPRANSRAAVISTFMGVVLLVAARALLDRRPNAPSFGLWLTAGLFALCGATHLVRAVYTWFGPPIMGLFLSGVQGALDYATAVPMSVFPIGFLLLADEVVLSDLFVARERSLRAEAEAERSRSAEAAMRESERLFRQMANTAPVMIWTSDVDSRCTYVNQSWLDFTGRPLDQELGNRWAEGIHADDVERCGKTYADAFDRRASFQAEFRLRRHDGAYRWVLAQGVPSFNGDGVFVGYLGSATDVTDHKRAEEALSTISRRLLAAQEEERARIARELHDDIGQQLAVVALDIAQVRQDGDRRQDADRLVDKAVDRIVHLSRSVNDLTGRLHPTTLEIGGLVPALRGLARELSRSDLIIDFAPDGVPAVLPKEITIGLFRVVQEALRNAVTHSGADRVSVSLKGMPNGLLLTIADQGVGFDMDLINRSKGLGLVSMAERVALIGGSLQITSHAGGGTRLEISVPLSPSTRVAGGDSDRAPSTKESRKAIDAG
jgi:PAS domain S-box-containing protein